MKNRIYRGFEVVRPEFKAFPRTATHLPRRSTSGAMAYDFYSKEDIDLKPGDTHQFVTDVKVYMLPNEGFVLNVRSGLGKMGIRLLNTQGWIDSDFCDNASNDGNISFLIQNSGDETVYVHEGDRIGQGMFISFLITDNDYLCDKQKRTGGLGHTGR